MAQSSPYCEVVVESFLPRFRSGLHGPIHIRPVLGQGYTRDMFVECSKTLSRNYPVGTKFKIQAKVTDRAGGRRYLYSNYRWPVVVMSESKAAGTKKMRK